MVLLTPLAVKERRSGRRHVSRLTSRCLLKRATEEGLWKATVQNISAEGIGLITNRPFKPGMSLTMQLPTNPRRPAKPVMVRVTHARPQPGNQWWIVGGTFSRKLTKEEVDFLRTRSPSIIPRSERRTLVRHTTRLKAPCPVIRAAEIGPWPATIRNVSDGGVGLIASRPFRPGTLLTVELPTRSGRVAKARLLRVRHARPQGSSPWWLLGGAFMRKLTVEEMEELL
jgi:hypothetical protein